MPGERRTLLCIASNSEGWDHVSISVSTRCPNWAEMEHMSARSSNDETAMHSSAPDDKVNLRPNWLHLWRPNDGRSIPRPPAILVA